MTTEYYGMSLTHQLTIQYTNYCFLGLMILEMILKLIAYGLEYFKVRWNQVDFFVILLSITGIIIEELPPDLAPVNPVIVTFPRVFRILRVAKLLKSASGVRQLLETLSQAIPEVFNLSLLIFLIFFIYASLGVDLYSSFDCTYEVCEGLSHHANFKHFGMALLTLFRVFTGDNWNDILKDVLWISSDSKLCARALAKRGLTCGMIKWIAPCYFMSFVLLSQFVLINVVVAVLMSQLEEPDESEVVQVEENENGKKIFDMEMTSDGLILLHRRSDFDEDNSRIPVVFTCTQKLDQ